MSALYNKGNKNIRKGVSMENYKQTLGQLVAQGKVVLVDDKPVRVKRPPRRIYVRTHSKKVRRAVTEAKANARRGRAQPSRVFCKVCYKKDVPIEQAIHMDGGGTQGHRSFWICLECV